MAQDNFVLVPMLVDVYVNYPSSVASTSYFTPPRPKRTVHLASCSLPDFQTSLLDSSGTQHDVFDQVRSAPYAEYADPFRVVDSRGGMYIHWTLPQIYRKGTAASESASSSDDPKASQVTYPPAPTRWLISRVLKPLPGNKYVQVFAKGKQQDYWDPDSGWDRKSLSTIHSRFLVESDYATDIKKISSQKDIEVRRSPFVISDEHSQTQQRILIDNCSHLHNSIWKNMDDGWPAPPPRSNIIPEVNVGNSANPFFADYQPHNTSVFSWFDDLKSLNPDFPGRFVNVAVSYTIVGFHSDYSTDPLTRSTGSSATVSDLLEACDLQIRSTDAAHMSASDSIFLSSSTMAARTICHGSKFSVPWLPTPTVTTISPALAYPGDAVQTALLATHPVAVGTNPIDALCGWFRAKLTSQVSESKTTAKVQSTLTKVPTLLADLTNEIDSQLQAEDLLGSGNYIRSNGERSWHLPPPPSNTIPTQPVPFPNINGLRELNSLQRVNDALLRKQTFLQKALFYTFWRYATQRGNLTNSQIVSLTEEAQKYSIHLKTSIIPELKYLGGVISNATEAMGNLVKATLSPFYIQRDPTLLIAGVESQWPTDFDQATQVRLLDQANGLPTGIGHANYYAEMWSSISVDLDNLTITDKSLEDAIFIVLDEADNVLTNYNYPNLPVTTSTAPLYHPGRDTFTGENAWLPLFIDWEVEYYEIPFTSWDFKPSGSGPKVRYGIDTSSDISQDSTNADYRIISGRNPILPQSSAHLKAMLKQLFERLPSDVIDSSRLLNNSSSQDNLIEAITGLDFLSTPMSGFTDQLVTCMQGTHLSPLDYSQDPPLVTQDAIIIGKEIGMTPDILQLMGSETELTPSSNGVPIPAKNFCPFKPCTHGQFRFRKLDVVDKFGQVASAILPVRDLSSTTPPYENALFPGLGERYSLDFSTDKIAGPALSVMPRPDLRNTFVQLPPSINQNARINCGFAKRTQSPSGWTLADEWDNSVIGWIIMNNADNSFQVFTADGKFVREFVLPPAGGTGKATVKPIDMDTTMANVDNVDLQNFLKIVMTAYPADLWKLLAKTSLNKHAAPTAFSGSMLSAMGRPLALVNVGVSLELADPAFSNQSVFGAPQMKPVLDYQFSVKYGDQYNSQDGFYGYWLPTSPKSDAIDYTKLYSYDIDSTSQTTNLRPIAFDQVLQPYYPDPAISPDNNGQLDFSTAAAAFQAQQDSSLTIFSALIDPYRPIHIYTDLLPVFPLQLPAPVLTDSLSQIAAYFSAGPVLVPGDVPAYNSQLRVDLAYRPDNRTTLPTNGSVQIPAVPGADWAWLQPYWLPDPLKTEGLQGETALNAMDVESVPQQARLETPPYTAVEGYLQMRGPFQAPDPKAGLQKV